MKIVATTSLPAVDRTHARANIMSGNFCVIFIYGFFLEFVLIGVVFISKVEVRFKVIDVKSPASKQTRLK